MTETIPDGGTLLLDGLGNAFTPIDMNGNSANTTLDLIGFVYPILHNVSNPVTDFGTSDAIIVSGFIPLPFEDLGHSYNQSTGVLSVEEYVPGLLGPLVTEEINISISGAGGTLSTSQFKTEFENNELVITETPCFAAGTRILTPTGQVVVEDLKVGDVVLTTRKGFESIAPIIWIGQRTIDLARHVMPEKVRPIVILAGAFGPGLPERDLVLSPDHALFIDGHLIEAKTLVNGVTVIVDKDIRHITYHHIELRRHDVVLAEGLPAETYLESGNRRMFESDATPMVLHPDFVSLRRERACARILVSGPVVTRARQRLLDRALALGFAVTGDVDLALKAGLERIKPTATDDGELLFVLPAGAHEVQLLSGTGVPAEISADPGDRRVLGVAVAGLALIANGLRQSIRLDDIAHEGFHDMEADHRWTNGAARIALPPYSGRAVLEVTILGQAARWTSVTNRQLSG